MYVIKSTANANKDRIAKHALVVSLCYENNSNIAVATGGLVNCKVVHINCNNFFFACQDFDKSSTPPLPTRTHFQIAPDTTE